MRAIALLLLALLPVSAATVGTGAVSPDSKEELICNLPDAFQQHNREGVDGKGLCVFASMHHAGIWQDDPLFEAMLQFMQSQPGGGTPNKVDMMLKKASADTGQPIPEYIQVEDNDIEILKLAVKCRYMPCVTYGWSPTGRYGGQTIYHMVNLVHASDKWFAVLDNNHEGTKNIEWMTPQEFKRAYTNPGGKGWSVILLTQPTPPKARNQ